jgi:hypothetical protein
MGYRRKKRLNHTPRTMHEVIETRRRIAKQAEAYQRMKEEQRKAKADERNLPQSELATL